MSSATSPEYPPLDGPRPVDRREAHRPRKQLRVRSSVARAAPLTEPPEVRSLARDGEHHAAAQPTARHARSALLRLAPWAGLRRTDDRGDAPTVPTEPTPHLPPPNAGRFASSEAINSPTAAASRASHSAHPHQSGGMCSHRSESAVSASGATAPQRREQATSGLTATTTPARGPAPARSHRRRRATPRR